MITPEFAAGIIIGFILLFGVVVPVLNRKAPKFVSYRWSVVVVVLALLIGAVVDFTGLSEDSRHTLLIGGLVIAGGYVLLRTIEKCLANGWLHGARIELKKGDAGAVISGGDDDKRRA